MGSLTETEIDYSLHPRVNSDDPVPPRPRPAQPPHLLVDDADAVAVATALAAELAKGAAIVMDDAAVASPKPDAAPVTTARFPLSRILFTRDVPRRFSAP